MEREEGEPRPQVSGKYPRGYDPETIRKGNLQRDCNRDRQTEIRTRLLRAHKYGELMLKHAPFRREVKVIVEMISDERGMTTDTRMARDAIDMLNDTTEIYMIKLLQNAILCRDHRKAKTLDVKDINLALDLEK